MKKLIITTLAFIVFGCSQKPKEINPEPLKIQEDSIVLISNQPFKQEIDNPSRGKIRVELYNASDSVKVFYINIGEK